MIRWKQYDRQRNKAPRHMSEWLVESGSKLQQKKDKHIRERSNEEESEDRRPAGDDHSFCTWLQGCELSSLSS